MRLRAIRDAVSLIKKEDPETELTEYTIRRLVTAGVIPSIKTGSKFLIDIDAIPDLLSGTKKDFSTTEK